MDINLKPCPFCGAGMGYIDYSEKVASRNHGTKVVYHGAMYCKRCNAYGRRVLSQHAKASDYAERENVTKGLRVKAMDAWNRRADDGQD